MEVLWILSVALLGVMLWDIHRGVKEISATTKAITTIAGDIHQRTQDMHQRTEDLHAKTDELLRRIPQP